MKPSLLTLTDWKTEEAFHDIIAQRVYVIFEQRGRQDGQDLADWLQDCPRYLLLVWVAS